MPRSCPLRLTALGFAVLLGVPSVAHAGPVGSAFAGVTAADPASLYWNPATMTRLVGTHGYAYGNFAVVNSTYTRDTVNPFNGQLYPTAELNVVRPNISLQAISDFGLRDWRFGIGAVTPILDGGEWKRTTNGEPSATRYFGINGRIFEILIEPAMAYRFNDYISVGFGIDVVGVNISHRSTIDLGARINQALCGQLGVPTACNANMPLVRENPAFDAEIGLGGMGWGVGVFFGALFDPLTWLHLGVGLHTGGGMIDVPFTVSNSISPALVDYVAQNFPSIRLPQVAEKGVAKITSPLRVTAGISADLRPDLSVSFDFQWIDRSAMSEITGDIHVDPGTRQFVPNQVLIRALHDTFDFEWWVSYWWVDALGSSLRLEWVPNSRPEEFMNPLSVSFDRVTLLVGLSWNVSGWFNLTIDYAHHFLFDRTVTYSRFAPNAYPTTPVEEGFDKPSPTGTYTADSDQLGVGLHFKF